MGHLYHGELLVITRWYINYSMSQYDCKVGRHTECQRYLQIDLGKVGITRHAHEIPWVVHHSNLPAPPTSSLLGGGHIQSTAEQPKEKSTEQELVPPIQKYHGRWENHGKPPKQGKNHLAQVMELLLESQVMEIYVLCTYRKHLSP